VCCRTIPDLIEVMRTLGLDHRDLSKNFNSAAGIGNSVAAAMISDMVKDGWNSQVSQVTLAMWIGLQTIPKLRCEEMDERHGSLK
jgi:hypothetical protein